LTVTEEERDRLQSLAHRSRSQALLARRARVVLACAEGLDNKAVAKKLRCSLGMVGKWRTRFLKLRLEGLYDEPRPGAPRKVGDEKIEAVVIQTLESTPRGQTHWSTRELAKVSGLSRMTISRIWPCLWVAAPPYGIIQTFAGSFADRKGARHCGSVHESS
jgi:transposase